MAFWGNRGQSNKFLFIISLQNASNGRQNSPSKRFIHNIVSQSHQQNRQFSSCNDKPPLSPVKGKVAIITGGARGIGFSIAEELLKAEAEAVIIGDILIREMEDATTNLNEKYGEHKALFQPTDVSKGKHMEKLFKCTKERFGKIDIVINNAGTLNNQNFEQSLNVNVKGVVRGTFLAFQYMQGKGGIIINNAAIEALMPMYASPVYSGTQHFILGFSRSMGHEYFYNATKVKVMAVCPGVTDTLLIKNAGKNGDDPMFPNMGQQLESYFCQQPSQPPEAVAKGVISMLTDGENGSIWISKERKFYKIKIPALEKLKPAIKISTPTNNVQRSLKDSKKEDAPINVQTENTSKNILSQDKKRLQINKLKPSKTMPEKIGNSKSVNDKQMPKKHKHDKVLSKSKSTDQTPEISKSTDKKQITSKPRSEQTSKKPNYLNKQSSSKQATADKKPSSEIKSDKRRKFKAIEKPKAEKIINFCNSKNIKKIKMSKSLDKIEIHKKPKSQKIINICKPDWTKSDTAETEKLNVAKLETSKSLDSTEKIDKHKTQFCKPDWTRRDPNVKPKQNNSAEMTTIIKTPESEKQEVSKIQMILEKKYFSNLKEDSKKIASDIKPEKSKPLTGKVNNLIANKQTKANQKTKPAVILVVEKNVESSKHKQIEPVAWATSKAKSDKETTKMAETKKPESNNKEGANTGNKEESKVGSNEKLNDDCSKEKPKDDSKPKPKDDCKEEPKEKLKEKSKDDCEKKSEDNCKEKPKEKPKDKKSKDECKETPKKKPKKDRKKKPKDHCKEKPKENPKDDCQKKSKDDCKEKPKDPCKEKSKGKPKDDCKETDPCKEKPKEKPKDDCNKKCKTEYITCKEKQKGQCDENKPQEKPKYKCIAKSIDKLKKNYDDDKCKKQSSETSTKQTKDSLKKENRKQENRFNEKLKLQRNESSTEKSLEVAKGEKYNPNKKKENNRRKPLRIIPGRPKTDKIVSKKKVSHENMQVQTPTSKVGYTVKKGQACKWTKKPRQHEKLEDVKSTTSKKDKVSGNRNKMDKIMETIKKEDSSKLEAFIHIRSTKKTATGNKSETKISLFKEDGKSTIWVPQSPQPIVVKIISKPGTVVSTNIQTTDAAEADKKELGQKKTLTVSKSDQNNSTTPLNPNRPANKSDIGKKSLSTTSYTAIYRRNVCNKQLPIMFHKRPTPCKNRNFPKKAACPKIKLCKSPKSDDCMVKTQVEFNKLKKINTHKLPPDVSTVEKIPDNIKELKKEVLKEVEKLKEAGLKDEPSKKSPSK